MLKDHPERACMYFAADYEPEVVYWKRVPEAAEVLQAKLKTRTWGTNTAHGYFFRVPEKRQLIIIDWQRLYAQGIGLLAWQTDLSNYGWLFKNALHEVGVQTLKRGGFKVWAFIQTGMSHAEMVDLLCGSFLVSEQDLQGICEKPEDALVQLHGSHGNMKLVLTIAPMNAEQSLAQVGSINNIEQFQEPKYFDTGLKEFRDRVVGDCLFLDIDLFRKDIEPGDIPGFLTESHEAANSVANATVRKLKGIGGRRGGR